MDDEEEQLLYEDEEKQKAYEEKIKRIRKEKQKKRRAGELKKPADEVLPPVDEASMTGPEFEGEKPVVIVFREEWGALPPRQDLEPLECPVKTVGITFNSNTPECHSKEECIRVVQDMQKRDMEQLNLPDVSFNWMVGGDGNIYEGRGWRSKPNWCLENTGNVDFEKMCDISYIGDFHSKYHTWEMYQTFINFIRYSILDNHIIEEFVYK